MIKTYIKEGNNPDQPGRLIQWLYPRVPSVPGPFPVAGSILAARKPLRKPIGSSASKPCGL